MIPQPGVETSKLRLAELQYMINAWLCKVSIQLQGVWSSRNIHESRRFMKNHVQIFVPKHPRTYEKPLLNLLKSSIPDIFTSVLTTFSIETLEKEGQDGLGSLTWFFEIAVAIFSCRFQRKIYKNFFMSVQCKKPPSTNTMFIDRSKFQEQFWKGSLKEHFWDFFQNLTNSFRDFLGICFRSYSQVAPIHQSLIHGQVKISLTIFERGHSRNISVNWELEAIYYVVLIDLVLLLN